MRTDPGRRPRLLVLSSTWPSSVLPGGATFVRELTRRLCPHFDITVLVPHAPGLALQELDGELHIRRYRYAPDAFEQLAYGSGIAAQLRERAWRWLLVPALLTSQAMAIRRIGREFRPDVVHAHWLIPQALAASLAGLSVPLACTCHGNDVAGFNGRLGRLLKRRAAGSCTALAVVSQGLCRLFQERLPAAPVPRVLSMGVDLAACFTPDPAFPRAAQSLLFVGRLIEFKGVQVLLEALARLSARHPGLRLDIAGDGPMRPVLEAQALALGLSGCVRFLGRVEQSALPALFRGATACVVPSIRTAEGYEEGLGLVSIEAMGCGCPVIGSDLPGMLDVLAHERTALVVPAGDPEALAAAIARLLADPAFAAGLAARARIEALARFDWQQVALAHAHWLGELAGNTGMP